jgi:hypothetical protein
MNGAAGRRVYEPGRARQPRVKADKNDLSCFDSLEVEEGDMYVGMSRVSL